jgi:small subunit ribosomal protein S25e
MNTPLRENRRRANLGDNQLTFHFRLIVKDKAQHAVILDKAINDKLQKDVQSYRLVTVAVLVDRLKINGSLARRALADLEERGVIKQVISHSACKVYSEYPLFSPLAKQPSEFGPKITAC